MTSAAQHRRPPWPLVAAGILLAVAFVYQLDGYALLDPDEGRNAEVAREMAATGDFVLPHLNGLPYLDKPIVFFATAAVFMKAFGATELAARMAPLLFTVLALVVVGFFARRLWGTGTAASAVVATGATPFVLAYSRTVIFDSAVMLWVVLSLLGFYSAVEIRREMGRGHGGVRDLKLEAAAWRWSVAAWAAVGLGLLTKGPVVLALALMIAVPYAVWRRAFGALVPAAGILVAVAIVLPWVLAVSKAVPDFVSYVVKTETAARLTTDALGRTGPLWYFLLIFPAAALPWSVVLAATAWHRRREARTPIDHRVVFLLLWIAVPLVFFTLSQSKRPQYVLPLVPAVGLALAGLWQRVEGRVAGLRAGAVTLAVLGVVLVAASGRIGHWIPAAQDAVAAAIPFTARLLGSVCVVAAIGAWLFAKRLPVAVLALAIPVASIPAVSVGLMGAIGEDRSARAIAAVIEDAAATRPDVIGVAAFPPSLPFYLGTTITLATDDGAELTSNYVTRHLAEFRQRRGTTLREAGWWRDALVQCRTGRVFVARADDEEAIRRLQARLPLVATTRKYAAFGPCPGGVLAEAATSG